MADFFDFNKIMQDPQMQFGLSLMANSRRGGLSGALSQFQQMQQANQLAAMNAMKMEFPET